MPKPWERDWGAPASPPSGPAVVFQAPPDHYKAASEARAAAAERRSEASESRAQAAADMAATKFKNENAETQTPGDTSLSGDAYLATIPQPLAAQVKALAEGRRAFPTGSALRAPQIQELIAAATQFDPTLDAANATTRVKARSDFTSGMTSRNITAMNTALGHLGTLSEAVKGLDNSSFPWWNSIANSAETAVGDPRVKNFTLARDAVANELMKVFRGSGGSLTEIEEWKQNIDASDSPQQLEATIRQGVELLNSRLEAVNDQYTRAMGRSSDPLELLSPHAREAYERLTGAAQDGEAPPPIDDENGLQINVTDDRPNGPPPPEPPPSGGQYGDVARESLGDVNSPWDRFTGLGAQGISLGLSDEAAGAGSAISAFMTGDNPATAYREGRDASRAWLDEARAKDPIVGGITEFMGGGGAARIASLPSTVLQSAKTAAAASGTAGYGYGEGAEGSTLSALAGAATGGVVGAALGGGFRKLGDYMRNRRPPTADTGPSARDVAAASSDLGVDMLPADAGGPFARTATTIVRSTPGGIVPITRAAQRSQRQAGDALSGIAAREGTAMDAEAMGNAVREGALKYRSGSRTSVGRVYDKAATAAGDARVTPSAALETLDRNIAELSEVPGGADGLSVLQSLRDDIAGRGSITVDGIRGMRTQLRQKFAKDNLRGSDVERRVNDVIEAASDDLVASLESQGKGAAARLYKKADRQWAERIKTLDDVIMPIIGKKGEKSGEQIVASLNSAAKGNNARLAKLLDTLPAEEAGAARATMIDNLGKATPGAQNAAGDEFSFGSFLTNWNRLGNSAKNSLFRGENRQAIDKLALLADRSKAAAKYQNYSGTAAPIVGAMTATTGALSIATLGKVLAGQYAAGSLLASPRVARAILGIAQAKTPEAIATRISNLSNIASSEPGLIAEISQLQQGLQRAMNDNGISRAVASPDRQDEQR